MVSDLAPKQIHNRREIRIKGPHKAKQRKYDTLNSSLMSYEQMENSAITEDAKRPTTRNLTAVRHHQNVPIEADQVCLNRHGGKPKLHSNSRTKLKKQKSNQVPSYFNRSVNDAQDIVLTKAKSTKSKSKANAKNYRRQVNYYQ